MNNEHSALTDIAKCRPNRRKTSDTSVQSKQIGQQPRPILANPLLKISDLKVGKRFREDLGNMDGLVESIRNNGLLCPIVITKGEYPPDRRGSEDRSIQAIIHFRYPRPCC